MTRLMLMPLFILEAGALIAAANRAHPGWAGNLGTDIQELPDLLQRLDDAGRLDTALQIEQEATVNRSEIRQHIVAELVGGRMTLREAARRFAELNAQGPDHGKHTTSLYPGRTDTERLYRQVIHWVRQELADQSQAEIEAVCRRLEAEIEDLKGR